MLWMWQILPAFEFKNKTKQTNKPRTLGFGEISQLVNRPEFDPQTLCTKAVVRGTHLSCQFFGGRGRRIPEAQ